MYSFQVTLSVVIITHNEEASLGRTLESVSPLVRDGRGEIIVVDSGSTDRTVEIAKSHGAQFFYEPWAGFAAQKNSAIDKAKGDWIFSLDADEEVSRDAGEFIKDFLFGKLAEKYAKFDGVLFGRRNHFLGRWIKHGGFYPDKKLRLFRKGSGRFEERLVHEDIQLLPGRKKFDPTVLGFSFDLLHHSYPTLSDYIDHMNRYSSLGAEMVVVRGKRHFLLLDMIFRPSLTFIYNYFFRRGFLDGREGLLLHLYHSVYVFWKYAKVWELQNKAS